MEAVLKNEVKGRDKAMAQPMAQPKTLAVACELAPVGTSPGLFYIGWTRPFTSDDFRHLSRLVFCWRSTDLEKNGTPDLDEGWRITGEGLEQAIALGYQVVLDGAPLVAAAGNLRRAILDHRTAIRTPQAPKVVPQASPEASRHQKEIECALAPILVRFLRAEVPIIAADLREYGPFRKGEVASIPFVHASVFVQNGAAEIFACE